MDVATIIAISAVSALVMSSPVKEPETVRAASTTQRHDLTLAPEAAANCVAHNASADADETAYLQPLYGMERIAVVMRKAPVGDTLATVFIERADQASNARVVTTTFVDDPDALTKRLLASC